MRVLNVAIFHTQVAVIQNLQTSIFSKTFNDVRYGQQYCGWVQQRAKTCAFRYETL
jgi:hypothetical protein